MVDWWCLGSLIYELIFKKPPFYCESRVDMYFEIVHQDLEIDENLDPVLKNFIKALLQKNVIKFSKIFLLHFNFKAKRQIGCKRN